MASSAHTRTRFVAPSMLIAALLTGSGCSPASTESATHQPTAHTTTGPESRSASLPRLPLTPRDEQGLHNVITLTQSLTSGSAPTTASDFQTLRALGITTVISVDAAPPEVELARSQGLRYIHIPIEYAGISSAQRDQLAVALRDAQGPVYLHCHHGKHRGPTAAALALIATNQIGRDRARRILEAAETSPSYPGLYRCIDLAEPLNDDDLQALDLQLTERATPSSMASAMARIDRNYARLDAVRSNSWITPADHPDLAPASLAAAIENDLRTLAANPSLLEEFAESADFIKDMAASANAANELEQALLLDADAKPSVQWNALAASCNDCHVAYRN